ncbi:MAG TPA: hypothetical protein VLK30_07930 [Candidatus Limnocylindrales bacterium]|nr:hypothetical protein [Candidatus Limnocylindrales bacterium]
MLAYVFAHRHLREADQRAYENALREFHARLASAPPKGFVASCTYQIAGAYSDWYLVDDSAALDALNEAAVSGEAGAAHDIAAHMATDGVGRLQTLAAGKADLDAPWEIRFAKPSGMSYGELYSLLQKWTGLPGVSLWRRMMVLGPPPEFRLVAASAIDLPAGLSPEAVARRRI